MGKYNFELGIDQAKWKQEVRQAEESLTELPRSMENAFKSGRTFEGTKRELQDMIRETTTFAKELKNKYQDLVNSLKEQGKSGSEIDDNPVLKKLRQNIDEASAELDGLKDNLADMNANGATVFNGLASGMQGFMGTFAAAQGVAAMFNADQEELVRIQTKLQACMSVVIGLQSASNALMSTSAFRTQLVTRLTDLWAAAQARLAAATGLAKLAIGGFAAAAAAAVAALVVLMSKTKKFDENSREMNKAVSASVGEQIAAYRRLQSEWAKAGDSLEKQRKVIASDDWKKLGIAVNTANDAERALVERTDAVVQSFADRARAAALFKKAEDEYSESIDNELESKRHASVADDGKTWLWGLVGGGVIPAYHQYMAQRKERLAKESKETAEQVTQMGIEFEQQIQDNLKKAGVTSTESQQSRDGYASEQKELANLYGSYAQKRYALVADWEAKIAKLPVEYQAGARRRMENELQEFDDQYKSQYGTYAQKREALVREWERRIAELPAEYQAEARHQMRVALDEFDSQYTETYGTRAQKRAALVRSWNNRIAELPARYQKEANRKMLQELDDFDNRYMEKYGTQAQQRAEKVRRMEQEVSEIEDEAAKDRARKLNAYAIAQWDRSQADKYGSVGERRSALEAELRAEIETLDDAQKELAEKRAKVRLAEFDYQQAMTMGDTSDARTIQDTAFYALLDAEVEALEGYTDAQREQYRKIRSMEYENNKETERNRLEYLRNYGSYKEQELAITEEYQKQIDLAREKGDVYLAMSLEKQRDDSIQQLKRQSSEAYRQIFADLASMSSAAMTEAIRMAENEIAAISGKAVKSSADIEAMNTLRERINAIREARDEVDFGGWSTDINQAIVRLGQMRQVQDELALWEEAKRQADEAGVSKDSEQYKNIEDAIQRATDKTKKLGDEQRRNLAGAAMNAFVNGLSMAADSMREIAEASGDVKLSEMADAVSDVAGVLGGAVQGFLSTGSVIGAAAGGVTSLIGVVVNSMTEAEVSAARARLSVQAFEDSIRLLKLTVEEAQFSDIFGTDQLSYVRESLEAARQALVELQGASDDLKNKWYWVQDPNNNWQHQTKWGRYLSKEDLWDENGLLDVGKAQAFLEAHQDINAELRQEIDAAIELREAYDKAMAAVDNYAKSIIGNFANDMGDAVVDSILRGEDAFDILRESGAKMIDNFARDMAKSMITQMLNERYAEDLKNAIATGDSTDLATIIANMQRDLSESLGAVNEAVQKIYDEADAMGVDMSSIYEEARESAAKGIATASRDSVDELNGRFTVIQQHTYEMNETTKAIKEQNLTLLSLTSSILLHVTGIHDDTTSIDERLSGMGRTMENMSTDIRRLSSIVDTGISIN